MRTLIKLLRMECWQSLVLSRVEIWWIDGRLNWETRCLLSASASIRYWRRWDRIRIVVRIQIILAQGEWSSAKEAKTILNRCNRKRRRTFCDTVNVYVFNIASICIHGEELLTQLAFHSKYKRSHDETDVRHIWEIGIRTIRWDLWSANN